MEKREIIESLIFSANGALPVKEIQKVLADISEQDIAAIISALNSIYEDSGRSFRIEHASSGYMFVTKEDYAPYIKTLLPETKLSNAAMEVLAVIAYKGPCSKQTIDTIRGVDSTSSLKNLLKLQLIDLKSGKPMMYTTTNQFLEVFGLNSLSDLPDIRQFEEIFGDDEIKPEGSTDTNMQATDNN